MKGNHKSTDIINQRLDDNEGGNQSDIVEEEEESKEKEMKFDQSDSM